MHAIKTGANPHSEHRFPAPSSKEGYVVIKPVLGFWSKTHAEHSTEHPAGHLLYWCSGRPAGPTRPQKTQTFIHTTFPSQAST